MYGQISRIFSAYMAHVGQLHISVGAQINQGFAILSIFYDIAAKKKRASSVV